MNEKLRYGDLDLLREHRASIMDSTSLSYGKLMREQLVNILERVINAAAERDALLAANESLAKDAEELRSAITEIRDLLPDIWQHRGDKYEAVLDCCEVADKIEDQIIAAEAALAASASAKERTP